MNLKVYPQSVRSFIKNSVRKVAQLSFDNAHDLAFRGGDEGVPSFSEVLHQILRGNERQRRMARGSVHHDVRCASRSVPVMIATFMAGTLNDSNMVCIMCSRYEGASLSKTGCSRAQPRVQDGIVCDMPSPELLTKPVVCLEAQRQNGLVRHVRGGHVEHLEHDLLKGALTVDLGVRRSCREQDGMFLGRNPELVVHHDAGRRSRSERTPHNRIATCMAGILNVSLVAASVAAMS